MKKQMHVAWEAVVHCNASIEIATLYHIRQYTE
jgi:hypothetical protein